MHAWSSILTYPAHGYLAVEPVMEDNVSSVIGVIDIIAIVSVSDENLRTSFL